MHKSSLYLVVIGTSAGGYQALYQLVKNLDPTINAAYCIVVHLSDSDIRSTLAERLRAFTSLPCTVAEEGTFIKKGTIYIAQPGKHLLVKKDKLLLGHGPEENNHKPSINVLFRSAAVAFKSRTIGVLLTGLMNDGTAGMEAIRLCGGTLIVQDPKEAEFPDMPANVINTMEVDKVLSLKKMGPAIKEIIIHKQPVTDHVPKQVAAEARRSERMAAAIEGMDELGEKSSYGCPECGGVLWEINSKEIGNSYRCHTGHVYTENELLREQAREAQSALWIAIRMMEERKHLLLKMAKEMEEKKFTQIAGTYQRKATDVKNHITKMKNLLTAIESGK